MTKDIQRAILRACARFIGKKVEPVERRVASLEQSTADLIRKGEVAELRTALEQRIGEVAQAKQLAGPKGDAGEQGPQGERGEPGERGQQGEPGRDAEPVDVDAIVDAVLEKLLASDRLKTLANMEIAAAVVEHFEANPVPPGKDGADGADGRDGEPGPRGEKGEPGADGVGLADALIDRDGALVVTMTDGRAKALGVIIGKDGERGTDGRDGLSMADVTREYDADSHEVVERWNVGGEAKELRYPAGGIRPGGFYREGLKCHALQAITHDGALWIAKRDTTARPCLENADDWQLAARKGRDGRDGKDGKAPPGPVKLVGGNGN